MTTTQKGNETMKTETKVEIIKRLSDASARCAKKHGISIEEAIGRTVGAMMAEWPEVAIIAAVTK